MQIKLKAVILFIIALVCVQPVMGQNNYKVRLKKPDGNGGLLVIKNAANRTSAQTAALADSDAGTDSSAIDIEKIDSGEAAARGQATETTLSGTKTSIDNFSAKMPAAGSLADGASTPSTTMIGAANLNYNGTSFDLQRGNQNLTILSSAARTSSPTVTDQINYNARGLIVVVDVTAYTGSSTMVITIEGKDNISGKYYTLLASAAISGTGTTILRVYPGLTAATNLVASDVVPRTFRIKSMHTGSDSITYSIGCAVIQ